MIDVMTPKQQARVHSFHCGFVPEIIDPGVTGHTISTMDEAIRMLPQVLALDCRTDGSGSSSASPAARMAKD
jgi:hypothetical protein